MGATKEVTEEVTKEVSLEVHEITKEAAKEDEEYPINLETIKPFYCSQIIFYHVGSVIAIMKIPECARETLLLAYVCYLLSMLGVTCGVHRLWAHRTYEASFPVRLFIMFIFNMGHQGTVIHWSRDHRVHHLYTDTKYDPHNAKYGFFYSHCGWLLHKRTKWVIEAGRKIDISDLYADPICLWQKSLHPWIQIFTSFFFPPLIATFCWGEDFMRAFWVAGVFKYCVTLEGSWFVNSAAHMFGDRPYDEQCMTSENALVSLLTLGEGWHNWHHKYPFDYAASEHGWKSQFNPSKMFIDFFALFGGVWGRKRATAVWNIGKQRRDRLCVDKQD